MAHRKNPGKECLEGISTGDQNGEQRTASSGFCRPGSCQTVQEGAGKQKTILFSGPLALLAPVQQDGRFLTVRIDGRRKKPYNNVSYN